jgi:chemotaxis signal transduction protein
MARTGLSAHRRTRVDGLFLMDDLLKVFLGETTECLTACWGAVERLRKVPGDSAALGDLLHQVRSVQETSKFLGMSALQAAAGLVLESLESASARRPASTDRIVPIAVDGLLRIEAVINAMANTEAEPGAAPASARSAYPLPAASPAPAKSIATVVESIDTVLTSGLPPIPAPAADGTVRINAETLGYLVSTVRGLVDAQAEMMRLLQAKEAAREAEPGAPLPTEAAPERPKKSAAAKVAPASAAPKKAAAPKRAAAEAQNVPPAQLLGAPSPGMVRVLLFRGADGAPKAAYLDQVAGLEEVDLKAVDHSRGLWVMRSGTDLLPLVAMDPAGNLPSGGRAPVIVFTVDRQSFGLLVDSVPEVADVTPEKSGTANGVVLLNGKTIEVIDPARYLDHAIRARVERRRPDRKRRAASDDHAPAPPPHDDLFVRKPTR